MIWLDFDEKVQLRATQRATAPCVYLDQWAYVSLVKGQQIERFATALARSGGTLAFSLFNFFELSQISNIAQLQQVENLFERVWPRLVFIQSDPTIVISDEDKILQGISNSGPHLDDWMLNKYVGLYRPGVNPLNPKGFLLQLRNPGVAQGFQAAWRLLAERMRLAFEAARNLYMTERDAKEEVNSAPKGKPIPHPTRYVFEQTVYGTVRNSLNTNDPNNVTDFFHMVVPLSYCNMVLLDSQWAERARQVQKSVRDASLLTHESAVYSRKNLDKFWSSIESPSAG